MKKILLSLLIVAATSQPALAEQKPLPAVTVSTVTESTETPSFRMIGRIEAAERVEIMPRVTGYLQQRLFKEGHPVEAGSELFVIEADSYQIAMEQAKAELASARAALKNAQFTLKRNRELKKRNAIAQAKLDQSEADRDQAQAQVMKAKAGLRKAELELSYTQVKAPITGRIGIATYSAGALVSPNGKPLVTIVQQDPIHVELTVSEKLMIEARRNGLDLDNPPVKPSLVLSDGSRYEHAGEFNYVSPEVDRNTDTVRIRATFPNPEGILLPGEFVHVTVRNKQPQKMITIPQSAVLKDRDGYYVLAVNRDNTVEKRPVQAGEQRKGRWQINGGLAQGERIITEGLQKVRPGIQVKAVEE
ncbi:efflux RND transporter periplasmic adaptor subunit [Marinobacterium jannaschii]|uniref:efflux RND transporter periplasmic adaptor subunit n=1 Tax=Marinobacterium jannaschii TaxID=64970 RepID=UPI000488B381|nr:efflux RND transporter periplasmic adaptor subunit [Marinobacterium jannaschii]